MSTTSQSKIAKVQYYENHIAPFTTNQSAIGLSSDDITEITAKTTAARDLYIAQQEALTASKNATQAFYDGVDALSKIGEACLSKIRNKAKTTGNPEVYTLASVTPPATPTPQGAPSAPFDFTASLDTDGSLKLKWKNSNGSNCVYWIYRAINGGTDFETLGGVGQKSFTDLTVPANSTQILYKVQAVRPTGTSPWTNFTVFLTGGTGSMIVKEGSSLKAAA